MESELIILNKYLKKMFPFVIEVENYVYEKSRSGNILELTIYVSPLHFCELMDDRVEKKLQSLMLKQSATLIKSIMTDCNPDNIKLVVTQSWLNYTDKTQYESAAIYLKLLNELIEKFSDKFNTSNTFVLKLSYVILSSLVSLKMITRVFAIIIIYYLNSLLFKYSLNVAVVSLITCSAFNFFP